MERIGDRPIRFQPPWQWAALANVGSPNFRDTKFRIYKLYNTYHTYYVLEETMREGPLPSGPVVPELDRGRTLGGGVDEGPHGRSSEDVGEIPSRMLNEFVYCPRLFYYEFVEGVFVENADTLRGTMLHKRVDGGNGALPKNGAAAKKKRSSRAKNAVAATASDGEESSGIDVSVAEPEVIHSRSVSLGSETLGVVAKLDLVEVRLDEEDLFSKLQVCPVDYKAGSPREDQDGAMTLWDTDKMQLGLQMLLLRENGYTCEDGVIYYRGTKQRVRLPLTAELETWIRATIIEARTCAQGSIPPPLDGSPKCVRCSLAPVCLPDETRILAEASEGSTQQTGETEEILQNLSRSVATVSASEGSVREASTGSRAEVRRLIAARDDTRALYLNTQGARVGRSSDVITVKEKERLIQEVRMNDLSHVALFGNIQMSTQALQRLCQKEIPITYFSMGGWFYGVSHGHGLKNVFYRIRQFASASDPQICLRLAQRLVEGKIRNQRTLLRRNHIEPPESALKRLHRAATVDVGETTSLSSLLGVEGAAAAVYFEHFAGMLKGDSHEEDSKASDEALTFDFVHRNRRPPRDPVNALLSLAYSLLAKDCTVAAMSVGLDPYVGFFHQPRYGRPALALDLMEEFRPLIADSAVITAINNRMVTIKDFVRAGDAVNLTDQGRKHFFEAYERRINHLVTHPIFDYQVSYRRAIELQFRMLARHLTGEISDYLPFTTR